MYSTMTRVNVPMTVEPASAYAQAPQPAHARTPKALSQTAQAFKEACGTVNVSLYR